MRRTGYLCTLDRLSGWYFHQLTGPVGQPTCCPDLKLGDIAVFVAAPSQLGTCPRLLFTTDVVRRMRPKVDASAALYVAVHFHCNTPSLEVEIGSVGHTLIHHLSTKLKQAGSLHYLDGTRSSLSVTDLTCWHALGEKEVACSQDSPSLPHSDARYSSMKTLPKGKAFKRFMALRKPGDDVYEFESFVPELGSSGFVILRSWAIVALHLNE